MIHFFKKRYPILAIAFSIGITTTSLAQEKLLQGSIIDANSNKPIAGATLQVVGKNITTTSSTDGDFKINTLKPNDLIEISYVGYETVRIPASQIGKEIKLQMASKDLDEVVVVAYGTSKRSNITGSVATINNQQIENRQVSNISKALEGQVPGLQSVASSGQPGTEATIRIRGIGSINASSNPLYVVDGVPYAGDINAINPNDIQSISVLKDAASSALYGSRGANGVIIITTKTGTVSEKTLITINSTQGYSNRAVKDYEQVSTDQYFELYWEALRNKELTNGKTAEQAAAIASQNVLRDLNINPYGPNFPKPIGENGKLVNGAKALWNDDWSDVLLQTGRRTQADLSLAGGTEKNKFYISGGYLNEKGIAIESGYKRYNLRSNIDAKVRSWLNAGLNIAGSSSQQKYPKSEDSNTANIINFSRLVPSFYPYYERNNDGSYKLDEKGDRIYDFGEYRPSAATPRNNMAATLPMDKNDINRENVAARTYLEAVLSSDLKFRTTYSVDFVNNNTLFYINPLLGSGVTNSGSVSRTNSRTISQTWNNFLTYEKQFNDHYLNVLAGHEYYDYFFQDMSGSREKFVLPGFYEPIGASQLNSFSGMSINYKLLSFLGRAEYNYQNKYYLSGSLRTDGSSRFAPKTRWGTFWSVGASWKLREEEFMKDIELINQFTLRASYGGQGNDNLGTYYAYQGLYKIANSLGQGGTLTDRLPTPELKWETNLNTNIGLDIAILKNRISLSVEYFNRQSKNLLFTMPMPISTGYVGYDANIGALKNVGFDIDLRTIPIRTNDFRWNLDLNLSHYKNTITELPNNQEIASGNKLLRVGGSIYDFYLPEWAGVDKNNGNPLWYKANANGEKTNETTSQYGDAGRFILGSSLPDLVGGLHNSFSYKNFDLSALLSFTLGGKTLDNDYIQLLHNGNNPGRSWSTEMLNRWTPENKDTDVPRLTTDNLSWTSASSRFIYSNTYARLKNVSLGYRFSNSLINKLQMQSARIFITGENVLTFYKHQGMDPEQTFNGATYFRYPAIRTFSAGIQVTF